MSTSADPGRLVQVVLTVDQAFKLAQTVRYAVEDRAGAVDDTVLDDLRRLVVFFDYVAADPSRFPVTSMTASLKRGLRRVKGPAQPQSRRNKRKARQEKRQSVAKRRRLQRREMVEAWNRAVAQIEAEMAEVDAELSPQQRIEQAVRERELAERRIA